ncbi:MAG: NAD(P)H-binding protein [Spirochaetes bacterium]|nr:NAD(P)H-binding protein [Spirochaetota bacterium]
MANRIVLVGGTGYLGSALATELAARGAVVVVAARGVASRAGASTGSPPAAGLSFHRVDITDPASLSGLIRPGDTVVHLVGLSPVHRPPGGRRSYRLVHVEGTRNLLRTAEQAEAQRFVYLSALGVTRNAGAAYAETKAQAEALVEASRLESTIVLPSILFSSGSEIIRLLRAASRFPVVPLPEIPTPFRPIHLSDAARRTADAILAETPPRRLPLTGPEKLSFSDFVRPYLRKRGTLALALPPALTPPLLRIVSRLKIPGLPAELDQMLAIDNAGDPPPHAEHLIRYSSWLCGGNSSLNPGERSQRHSEEATQL